MYSQTPNIDTFLKAHCGDSIRVDRKGRRPEFIDKPCLTTLLFIQPDVLRGLVRNETFLSRGLVARFLYSYPQSRLGSRVHDTEPIPQGAKTKFRQLCDDMLDIHNQEPKFLTLSEEAQALSKQFYDALEPRLGKDGDLEHMTDWAGKLHGSVLRIAGLLHVIEGVAKNGKEFADITLDSILAVSVETMTAAIEIGYYFLEHAKACYSLMETNKSIENAVYVVSQIEKKRRNFRRKYHQANCPRMKYGVSARANGSARLMTYTLS